MADWNLGTETDATGLNNNALIRACNDSDTDVVDEPGITDRPRAFLDRKHRNMVNQMAVLRASRGNKPLFVGTGTNGS